MNAEIVSNYTPSTTLFHFTNSINNLISILTHGFKVNECEEDFTDVFKNGIITKLPIPMVSFCDIPLTRLRHHLIIYGKYGIGMSKNWALRNYISPIIYLFRNGTSANAFDTMIYSLKNKKIYKNDSTRRHIYHRIIKMLNFMKPYSGKFSKNEEFTNYDFYSEREWRYSPENSFNKNLCFNESDIKYIIVSNKHEINDLILHISKNYSGDTASLLLSKLISFDNIQEDF